MLKNWTLASQVEGQIDPCWMSWLASRDSLTKKLGEYASCDIKVKVLFQGWSTPNVSECQILGLTLNSKVLVREVILSANSRVLVHARTLIPEEAYVGSFSFVAEIGSQPLGQWLFTQQGVERGEIEVMRSSGFNVSSALFEWGRRSTFVYKQSKILITEYFVEDFVNAYPSKN